MNSAEIIADINIRLDAHRKLLADLESELPTPGWAARVASARATVDALSTAWCRAMGVTS